MFQEKINFKNSRGLTLAALLEGERKDAPLVVMCHGYSSSKNGTSTEGLTAELIKRGLTTFRFDFTGNGESEGKLEQLTPLQGLDDLESAVSHLGIKNFGLYGGSFGGHVALMYASKNAVVALALRAAVSDYSWVIKGKPSERREGWVRELEGLDLYEKASNISAPVLIVHGGKDEIVPVEQSKKLFESLKGEKHLEIIKETSHQFRGELLKESNDLITDFLQENLLK